MKRYLFFYFAVISIPLFLGLCVWQSNRYQGLKLEMDRLEQAQADWVERNNRLIADIAVHSSPERIERYAKNNTDLRKIQPEDILQITIEGGKGHEF